MNKYLYYIKCKKYNIPPYSSLKDVRKCIKYLIKYENVELKDFEIMKAKVIDAYEIIYGK